MLSHSASCISQRTFIPIVIFRQKTEICNRPIAYSTMELYAAKNYEQQTDKAQRLFAESLACTLDRTVSSVPSNFFGEGAHFAR